jgi:hypothetical protein
MGNAGAGAREIGRVLSRRDSPRERRRFRRAGFYTVRKTLARRFGRHNRRVEENNG